MVVVMSQRRILKLVHLAGTAWFVLCVGYILFLALRQASVNWWLVFSLSGHGALIVFLLISLYLFAVFRGVGRNQKIKVEHTLTSTNYYMMLYVIAPFIGGLAGWIGMAGVNRISQFLLVIALGTLGTTFLVWVIVDPVTGLLEMLLPASRKHRAKRLAQAKAQREKKQKDRESLLAEVLAKEDLSRRHWQQVLKPQAEKLAGLLLTDRIESEQAECEAVDIGASAWQIGGLSCMRALRDMAITICRERNHDKNDIVDYISIWWDGVGSWRSPSFEEMINS